MAKNPSDLPSGDQKGRVAPSVLARDLALRSSRERTQSEFRPSETPTNASRLPSGENAIGPASRTKAALSGGRIEDRTIGAGCSPLFVEKSSAPAPNAA